MWRLHQQGPKYYAKHAAYLQCVGQCLHDVLCEASSCHCVVDALPIHIGLLVELRLHVAPAGMEVGERGGGERGLDGR